ncbi:hypothetical protein D9611_013844 [Ephemerocybe angulata]|uniref:Peptidase C19 ubiquitin carboxyl-terminal hydrolase domain-containing protein n=1 Tax=Ephemerocybe angulata TaxID=980116 RepID=A0A8H5BVD1_9AGAR|nr:hypothetical protein D9611_013844 [Tulosesus angulatus]
MTELQIEQTLRYGFSLLGEDGQALQPMVKVADGLLSGRYSHPENTASLPPSHTSADRLQHERPAPVFQKGVRPMGFKRLVGKGHEEFVTMRQQDSEEFFTWLISVIGRDLKKYAGAGEVRAEDSTGVFSYALEQRLMCGECKRVRYRRDEMDVVSVGVPANVKPKRDAMKVAGEGEGECEEVELTSCLEGVAGY